MASSMLRTALARSLAQPRSRHVLLARRHAKVFARAVSGSEVGPDTATSASTLSPPPPPPPRESRWRKFLAGVGKVTLITVVAVGGSFYYLTYKDRHPGVQLPYDPSKKNIVVLGSGWAATSFLKNIDNTEYNVIVVSPRNFFLFTPLLPSVAVGTTASASILQPTRYLTRHKPRQVTVIEAEVKSVDPEKKIVTFADESEVKGAVSSTTINYDYLIYAVGAETQTFGIPGVQENACFMKEITDAENMKRRFMDCIETAAFPGQSQEEIDRLLHMVVVGGGPTGVEVSGEIYDFLVEDLKSWYPELADRIRITLVEALPSVLPMFSKKLIDYTISSFKEAKIDVMTNTMVKQIKEQSVVLQMPDKTVVDVPVGMVVWAGGNKPRQVSVDLMNMYSEHQKNRRGITIDDCLRMVGPSDGSLFALGDCTSSGYAPTAQVASQQGAYLAGIFHQLLKRDAIAEELAEAKAAGKDREAKQLRWRLERANNFRPFHYSHQGSLAYIGHDRAIADVNIFNKSISSGGVATFLFWRSAYLSTLFSLRNRFLVANDWIKCRLFGRDLVRD